jgi:hypothetical protein
MKLIGKVRSIFDREWIKVDWCGSQTIVHRLIAATPLLVTAAAAGLVSSRSGALGAVLLGMAATVAISIWIEGRRLTGTGAFNTRRSEGFVQRMRRGRGAMSNPERGEDL